MVPLLVELILTWQLMMVPLLVELVELMLLVPRRNHTCRCVLPAGSQHLVLVSRKLEVGTGANNLLQVVKARKCAPPFSCNV